MPFWLCACESTYWVLGDSECCSLFCRTWLVGRRRGGEGWGCRAGGLAPRQHLPRLQVLPIPTTPSSSEGSASGPFGVNYSNPGFSVWRKQALISLIKVKYDPFLCLRILLPRLRESSFLFIRNRETLHQAGGLGPRVWGIESRCRPPCYVPSAFFAPSSRSPLPCSSPFQKFNPPFRSARAKWIVREKLTFIELFTRCQAL